MPGFHHNLMGIGEFCDADCKFLFTKTSFNNFYRKEEPVITGCRDNTCTKLWNISLLPNENDSPACSQAEQTTLGVYSAYHISSVSALVRYFHAASGYPVIPTWLNTTKSGNYASWWGLTYNNASRYCPLADETIKGHMVHTGQGIRSTRKSYLENPETTAAVPAEQQAEKTTQELGSPPNEIHIRAIHTSKLYIDDTGGFPVRSRSGN